MVRSVTGVDQPSERAVDGGLAVSHARPQCAPDEVLWSIPGAYFGHPFGEGHRLPVGAGGHVEVPEQVTHQALLVAELVELLGHAELAGFVDGGGVMGDQTPQPLPDPELAHGVRAVEPTVQDYIAACDLPPGQINTRPSDLDTGP